MCGIAGILHLNDCEVAAHRLRAMIGRIRHRGPDEAGLFVHRSIGFAHARLSLLDLAHGQQPMQTTDGNLTISFNGEIFNHLELRHKLESLGAVFHTRSDTEVVLQAFAQYGDTCVEHFNGQWAFAIWDERDRRLFLSRDRFGIRPLFFAQQQQQFLFASEIKALLADPLLRTELDPHGMREMFTFWTTVPPRTVFRHIQELPPGHNLVVQHGHIQTQRYWQLDFQPGDPPRSTQQQSEELAWLLQDATRLRLAADVPVAAYLSGGLDSSIITALAQHHIGRSLMTFSVAFPDEEFDESNHQQQVVQQLQTEHATVHCGSADLARVFPQVVWHAEKPLLRTAPAPLFLLARLVRQAGIKAVVTGEGADEMLGGYDIFKEAKVRRFCARQPQSPYRARLLQRLYPYLPQYQKQSNALRQAFFKTPADRQNDPLFSHLPRWEMTFQIGRFFSPDFMPPASCQQLLSQFSESLPDKFSQWHPFGQAQFLESTTLLSGYILSSQGDRMAMAHSVEGRFPFLDHRVAELAMQIPPRLKMHGVNEKFLLKKALGNQVPNSTLKRTKQPYRAPGISSFFCSHNREAREDYVEQLFSPERIQKDGIFHAQAVSRLLKKIRSGKAVGTRDDMALVGILSTQLLVDQFLNTTPTQHLPTITQGGRAASQRELPLGTAWTAPVGRS